MGSFNEQELYRLESVNIGTNINLFSDMPDAIKHFAEEYLLICKKNIEDPIRNIFEKFLFYTIQTKNKFLEFTNELLCEETNGTYDKLLYDHISSLVKHIFYYQKKLIPALYEEKLRHDIEARKLIENFCSKISENSVFVQKNKKQQSKIKKYLIFNFQKAIFDTNKKFVQLSIKNNLEYNKINDYIGKICNNQIDNIAEIILNTTEFFNQIEKTIRVSFEDISLFCNEKNINIIQEIYDPVFEKKAWKFNRKDNRKNEKNSIIQIQQWQKCLDIDLNSTYLFFVLLKIKLWFRTNSDYQKNIYLSLINQMNEFFQTSIDTLENYCKNIKLNKNVTYSFNSNTKLYNDIVEIKKNRLQNIINIKNFIEQLPENIFISDNYDVNGKDDKIKDIYMSIVVKYIVENEFQEAIRKAESKFIGGIERSFTHLQDKLRFFAFVDDEKDIDKNSIEPIIEEKLAAVKFEYEQFKAIVSDFDFSYSKIVETVESIVSFEGFLKYSENFRQRSKKQARIKKKSIFSRTILSFRRFRKIVVDFFWYNQSKGLIFVRKFKDGESVVDTRVHNLHNILEQNEIGQKTISFLPYHYVKMFTSKSHFTSEFFVGREDVLKQAELAVFRHNSGYGGGLLIHGKYNSGKSMLSHYIAKVLFSDAMVYIIDAKDEGSSSIDDFEIALKKSLGSNSIDSILSNEMSKSVVIIDEIEMWWEKSINGLDVISQICNLIDKYGRECFFIVNIGSESLKVLNKLCGFKYHFLSILECNPVDATTLEKIILLRHSTIGMDFKLRNKKSAMIKIVGKSRFFARLFNNSHGNIGEALNIWTKNIFRFSNNCVSVKLPPKSTLQKNDFIAKEWYMLLCLFVLHKRMDIEKISRVSLQTNESIKKQITILENEGLIVENNGIWKLNPAMNTYIVDKLIEKRIL